MSDRKNYYVDNDELYREICASKEKGELTPRALKLLCMIADKAIENMHYNDRRDYEDCLACAYMEFVKYWKSFDPKKTTNAFSYYTQMVKNGYARGWNAVHPKKYKGTISISSGSDNPDGIFTV